MEQRVPPPDLDRLTTNFPAPTRGNPKGKRSGIGHGDMETYYQQRRKQKVMVFRRIIRVPAWDAPTRELALGYWRERGFRFTAAQKADEEEIGWRGSAWGNLTSYNMSKLRASLTILTGDRAGAGASIDEIGDVAATGDETLVQFEMHVDTWAQHISEWNRAYWLLELATAESWLLHGDKQEAEWRRFLAASRKAALIWSLTLGHKGSEMPPSSSPPSIQKHT